jgi:hypothetical protein
MTGQSKRRDEVEMRPRIGAGIDRDRPAGRFDRLIVLLQPEIVGRFTTIPISQSWISRAQPNRLVLILQALFKLPEIQVVRTQSTLGVPRRGVQSKRAFELRDRFVEAPLDG